MPNRFEKYLELGDILEFRDPNQHFGERLTENLDQILHAIHCKRDAKAGWPPRAISSIIIEDNDLSTSQRGGSLDFRSLVGP